ncbi:formylglycine-generating enzyme family protein [Olivibacter domesticus]|uniref:Formylglycine-generating enzyme, required for sulfatase activity, contains SUMF1/FGE domain n=1 Tax=Olivibacter domesticus TaxID=407022 RepID=A0A1H7I6D8_OLID1|nr:SUMF1/EgtB/PvdO family nonheme iron enzyme [Olivibacter domesticus]SEK57998.1 Formylglycine-generating enzyme, required for sulfatase activity, contains SUMF1/FGE domain [Olivibacter domesticus]
MKRKLAILLFLATYNLYSYAQNNSSYTQNIDGTKLSFEMKAIPKGTFDMGDDQGNPDEKPIHKITLDGFWIGTYEVTWDLFEPFLYKDYEVTQSTGGKVPPNVDAVTRPTKPYLDMTFGMGKEGHPAIAMTHYNAIQFCKWLYERTGVFYRLPTEAEWEYACRAGSTSKYTFGDDEKNLGDYAWYVANSDGVTHKVGEKKPNAWGLFDMHGNVSEWTYDQYDEKFYASSPQENPVNKPTKLYPHSVRGGAYDDEAMAVRSASRLASDPTWKQLDPQIPKSNWWFPEAPFVGFRVVRPLTPPSKAEIDAYYDQPPIADK